MRKSSLGGRPSLSSGPPLRVRQENTSSISGPSSSKAKGKSRSLGGPRPSAGARGASSQASTSARISFLPKTNRPSSGIGVRGRTDVPKDTRPVTDKKWQRQQIDRLLEFLMKNNYPHPISKQLLVSPTSKDFFKIFEFIYKLLQPDYKMTTKMEEEVPRVLRLMAYPFNISKTYLYSVGAAHTWPHLLAALSWMLDIIMTANTISQCGGLDTYIFGGNAEDFDSMSEDQLQYDYNEKTYDAYMKGADTFPELDAELVQMLKFKYQGEPIDKMEEENLRMEMELNEFDMEQDGLAKLQEKIAAIRKDERALAAYLEELDKYRGKLQADVDRGGADLATLNLELNDTRERLKEMQLVYQSQDLTSNDVARMRDEQGRLRQQVEQLEKQLEDMDGDNWKVQLEMAKVTEDVEKEVQQYNREAIKLKLVPETAPLAEGRDYRLKAGYSSDIERMFKENIMPVVTSMKIKHTDNLRSHDRNHFNLKCKIEKLEESNTETEERLAKKEKELATLESEISSLKLTFSTDKQTIASSVEGAQHDLEEVQKTSAQLEGQRAEVTVQHSAALRGLEERKVAAQKELQIMDDKRKQSKQKLDDYKAGMEEKVKSSIAKMKVVLEKKKQNNQKLREEAVEREARITKLLEKRKKSNNS